MPQIPSLIVHGGAWSIPPEADAECLAGCRRALEAGWRILSAGGAALDAVEAAIVLLEDEPVFDAGLGSHLNRDGVVQLDAIIMEGRELKAGAVAAVERVKNPIRLARKVLEESEHMMLAGAGAELFAQEHGITLCAPKDLVLERERQAWLRCAGSEGHKAGHHFGEHLGTVGAVALDVRGDLVAGTSTGGTCCKLPGRVGDSPLIGCGCYADVESGGVSCTGWGEAIMRVVLAKAAADMLRSGASAQDAAAACVKLLAERTQGSGGLILLDRHGTPGFAHNTSHLAYGFVAPSGSLVVGLRE
jgi:beta-aspartyl-peptidase (threonine type)